MLATAEFPVPVLTVEPWPDPVIDQLGHDPRSAYVERFWLGILGPSTVWLLRLLAAGLDERPEGFELDVAETAMTLGLGTRGGRNAPLLRSLERTCRFGAARMHGEASVVVRRKLPPLTRAQVERLPDRLRAEHEHWQARSASQEGEAMRRRARALAASLLDLGEDVESAERQLHRWRFHPAIAHDALRWAQGERD
jgi:hypothetical protein